jgi:hypothetical protein
MRIGDEILEIALPAAAVIGEEDELAGAGDRDPAGGVDGADRSEESGRIDFGDVEPPRPESGAEGEPAHRPGLAPGDRDHVVLGAAVLALVDLAERLRIGRAGIGPVVPFLLAQREIEQGEGPEHEGRHTRDRQQQPGGEVPSRKGQDEGDGDRRQQQPERPHILREEGQGIS